MSSIKICKCGSLASWNSYFGGYYCHNCGLILEDGLPDGGRGGHLMDIEKLIERLRTESLYADKASLEIMDLCMDAATALSTLQAENEKLRTELEQVTAERDAAVKDLNEFLAMDELCPIQCEWCKWKDTFCDGKTPEWRGQKED